MVTDTDGQVLVDTGSGELPPLVDAIGVFTDDMSGTDDDVSKPVDDRALLFVGFASSPSIPWAELAIIAGVAELLAAGAAAVLSRIITRPLKAFDDATRAVRAGDLAVRVDNRRPHEIAGLAESFNHMTDAFRTSTDVAGSYRRRCPRAPLAAHQHRRPPRRHQRWSHRTDGCRAQRHRFGGASTRPPHRRPPTGRLPW